MIDPNNQSEGSVSNTQSENVVEKKEQNRDEESSNRERSNLKIEISELPK